MNKPRTKRSVRALTVQASGISEAWGRVFLNVLREPGFEVSPLSLTVYASEAALLEDKDHIRDALNEALVAQGYATVDTVANTIFPENLWRWSGGDRQRLYEHYMSIVPRIKALEPKKNGRGLYFERLICWPDSRELNQLERIIASYRPGVRRSKFIASIFDPGLDHSDSWFLGFPCMQSLSFVPIKNQALAVNAFYPTQQLFDKAYGNYLGLFRLGRFMAQQMKLRFSHVSCFVGVAKLERVTKQQMQPLARRVGRELEMLGTLSDTDR